MGLPCGRMNFATRASTSSWITMWSFAKGVYQRRGLSRGEKGSPTASQNCKYVETSFHVGSLYSGVMTGPELVDAVLSAAPEGLEVRVVMGMRTTTMKARARKSSTIAYPGSSYGESISTDLRIIRLSLGLQRSGKRLVRPGNSSKPMRESSCPPAS